MFPLDGQPQFEQQIRVKPILIDLEDGSYSLKVGTDGNIELIFVSNSNPMFPFGFKVPFSSGFFGNFIEACNGAKEKADSF